MIDFPIIDLLDDSLCLIWLERYLSPNGLPCPPCARTARWLFRDQGHFPAYRCRGCDGYYTLLTGTIVENTQQRPAILVMSQVSTFRCIRASMARRSEDP